VVVRLFNFTVRWQVVNYGPLLDRTRQAWKPRASNLGTALGVAIMVATLWRFDYFSHPDSLESRAVAYLGISSLIIAVSLYLSVGAIRCPSCGDRWMWRALKIASGRWLHWLRDQQVCPACGARGDLPPDNSRRGP
jgi:hypothetical protein